MTTSAPRLVSLAEFMALSAIDPSMLIRLLETGAIPFEKGPVGELLVDMERFDFATLANTSSETELSPGELRLIEEAVATEVITGLEKMLSEAFEMALRWRETAEEKGNSE